ncbi:hypothetical protein DEU56DRAFT_835199 [Suillus clintonianus]|uniref:uncharacterized protein n=1 Tax=Suillus clintonianus TaxID=1904413 RepID=UPI001B86C117|nr:uncharacterized protein DEU56DRAFT_835199 [Suillus clintonianus]KAG2121116.1 hypothetical protein DEU56DRAFT_835199 [Suillus clintonianus]
MQGRLLTEDDLEKYFACGEYPWTSLVVPPSSVSLDWQQPHSTTFDVGGPPLTSRCSSGSPSHDQWVYRIPEIQQLPSGSRTNPSCCTPILGPDPMSEANIWTRMVTRSSLKRSRRFMSYDMQQDVLNVVRIDDSLSAESVTVVEMPSSLLKPVSYIGNKPPEKTMDTFDEKSLKSIQSDSTHSIGCAAEAKSEGKGKGIEKRIPSDTCFLSKLRLNKAWNRLRCWTTTALKDMKSRTVRLSSATRPIRLAGGCTDQRDIWRYPQRNDDRGQPN